MKKMLVLLAAMAMLGSLAWAGSRAVPAKKTQDAHELGKSEVILEVDEKVILEVDEVSRPAPCTLALRIDSVLDGKATVRLAALNVPEPEKKSPADLLRGPFNHYSIPLDGDPHRIGWQNPDIHPFLRTEVILGGKKYSHKRAKDMRLTHRHANGAISVSGAPERPHAFQVRGVYGWEGLLFIIDTVLVEGDVHVLIEPPPSTLRIVRE